MSLLKIQHLVDDPKCFETLREMPWPQGVTCPHCHSQDVTKRGFDDTQKHRQRYLCKSCHRQFDDLTDTVFAGHHRPLKTSMLCLYLMGLNFSNAQIAQELNLNKDDVPQMTTQLRQGIVAKKPRVLLQGEVDCDEVYVIAGHKGKSDAVKKKDAKADGGASKASGVGACSPRRSPPSSA